MSVNLETLLEGLNPKRKFMMDINGKSYKVGDFLQYYHKGVVAQMDKNLIPKLYEKPLGVQFELTYKCNQHCIHCYNQSGDYEYNSLAEELSVEEWKSIAKEAGKLGVFQCVISGGEPTLLGDSLFEIMDILDAYGVRFVVISNGMLIDNQMVEKFKKYTYSWFQISIDGSRPELHNAIRGANSFEKALDAANLIKEAGIPLVIAHSIMQLNKNYLGEMFDLCYLLGACKVMTGPISHMGRAVLNNEQVALTHDDILEIYKICDEKALEYSGKMQITLSAEEPTSLRVRLAEPNGVMLIRPNGDVKFDCVSPFKIGNTKKDSLETIWNERGKHVYKSQRLIEYVTAIKTAEDMLHVKPRVNVDPDELLEI